MSFEVRADPSRLVRTAQVSLDESVALLGGLTQVRGMATLPAEALGPARAGKVVANTHDKVLEAAGTVVERLVAVLEYEADSLLQTAFAYRAADQAAAEELASLPLPERRLV